MNNKSAPGSCGAAFNACYAASIPPGLHPEDGKVNGVDATVLRDSGCNTSVVSDTFVHDYQYLQDSGDLFCVANHKHTCPKAKVHVDSPYFVGDLECFVVENLVVDMIIGNVEGVPQIISRPIDDKSTACVTTRAQTKQLQQMTTLLPTPIPPGLDVTLDVLTIAQADDENLPPFLRKLKIRWVVWLVRLQRHLK